jgi:metal-responsive CopG/Arc/MetJ family transcriptional regulator
MSSQVAPPTVDVRGLISLSLPVSLIQRIEAAAPSSQRARSAFIRRAIERELARLEQPEQQPA